VDMNTPEGEGLRAFRRHGYALFGCRREALLEALLEALDALVSAPTLETPAHLSLAPHGRRGWGSLYEARHAGTLDLVRLEHLVAAYHLQPQTTWFAVDASLWPRCDAQTRPERGFYPPAYRHSHAQPIGAGWNSSWLAQVPLRSSRWTAPLRGRGSIPAETPNLVAAEQVRSWLGQAGPLASMPIFTFAAGYDAVQLRLAVEPLPVGRLVRLRAGRCFCAEPTTQPATGRARRQGGKCVGADPATGPAPTDTWSVTDPHYGSIAGQAWSGWHAAPQNHATRGTRQPRPRGRGTLIRLDVERLPRPTKAPTPRWFWGWGPTPPDLAAVGRASIARCSMEHTGRFFKPTLRWPTPKLRSPRAADRCTWLVILADGQLRLARDAVVDLRLARDAVVDLRLARDAVVDLRLPGPPLLPPARRPPARVRRGFSPLLPHLGSPVCTPQPCGHSPGRPSALHPPCASQRST
jgi:hypothetical protein